MLKLPKGLKKKKKGKKSKRKDDELFNQEELEAYRRVHQQQHPEGEDPAGEEKPAGENEEWKKFNLLASGVDDILKKTQGDLDRIKSTSFYQRAPTAVELQRQEEEKEAEARAQEAEVEEQKRLLAKVEAAIVEVSDSGSEEEEEDDIFDTTYIDAVAAGEVKLAYIPESPTEPTDDDPFDTAYAEKAILGPNTERKGTKLVPLGSAVEILTGRVQAPSCVPIKRPSARRQAFQEQSLLLSSFDASNQERAEGQCGFVVESVQKTLLDDDAPEDLASEPIDLEKVLVAPSCAEQGVTKVSDTPPEEEATDILEEFDVLQKHETPEDDDDDKEFALLAAESLTKPKQVSVRENLAVSTEADAISATSWNAFGQSAISNQSGEFEEPKEDDPFDTTFAEIILPGQTELKQIEEEILDGEDDLDFDPRAGEPAIVSIHLTNPSGQRESVSSLDPISESELISIKPIHRDLLGGSNTDLSQLSEAIIPKEIAKDSEEDNFDYSDPFDTSGIDTVTLPRSAELKFLERELLEDQGPVLPTPPIVQGIAESLSDEEFDPRAFGSPSGLLATNRKVSFDLPLPKPDLLSLEEHAKIGKPLTPYYVRENSIVEQDIDPFDTSFVETGPGQAELKLIESELFNSDKCACDFNPRDEKQLQVAKVVQEIEAIARRPSKPQVAFVQEVQDLKPIDLLGAENDLDGKVLTPAPGGQSFEEDIDIDPFDTSIACNILPGKTELRLLENELITNVIEESGTIKQNLTDPDFDPRKNLDSKPSEVAVNLLEAECQSGVKALTPLTVKVSFDIAFDDEEDIDPFDTSIANNIAPGPSELKLLESELI